MKMSEIQKKDKQAYKINQKEEQRQAETIDLIASQNYASIAVRQACSSVFTNKYSEGYPNRRYYPGNTFVDEIETLAQQRALELFNLNKQKWSVNVQAYSGSPANLAIYTALLSKNDVALGMSLMNGGHLTHGHPVTASGRFFNFKQYGLNKNEEIDFENLEKMAQKYKPKIIVCGATAYSLIIDFERFSKIAKKAKALLVADISHIAGLIASGTHPSPFPYADVVMTTTHKTLRGPRGALIFAKTDLMEKIDKAIIPGLQGGPHNNTTLAIAISLKEAMSKEFTQYANQIVKNAKALSEELQKNYRVVSGKTQNHLFLLDFSNKPFKGKEAEQRLEQVGITANRNTIPREKESPFNPSGIRIGTPAVTTRGMKEKEMRLIAEYINNALEKKDIIKTKALVKKLALKFPPK